MRAFLLIYSTLVTSLKHTNAFSFVSKKAIPRVKILSSSSLDKFASEEHPDDMFAPVGDMPTASSKLVF